MGCCASLAAKSHHEGAEKALAPPPIPLGHKLLAGLAAALEIEYGPRKEAEGTIGATRSLAKTFIEGETRTHASTHRPTFEECLTDSLHTLPCLCVRCTLNLSVHSQPSRHGSLLSSKLGRSSILMTWAPTCTPRSRSRGTSRRP